MVPRGHLVTEGFKCRNTKGCVRFHRLQTLRGEGMFLEEVLRKLDVRAGTIDHCGKYADERAPGIAINSWNRRKIKIDAGFSKISPIPRAGYHQRQLTGGHFFTHYALR